MLKALVFGYRTFLAALAVAIVTVGVAEVSPAQAAVCPGNYTQFRNSFRTVSCYCPANRIRGRVWGTGVYTDDSSICRAARHAGAITSRGGNVTVRGARGRTSYRGSNRNGIRTSNWSRWHWSFTVAAGGGGGGNVSQICRNYASTAVRQNNANLRRRCGYRGGAWQSNYQAHFNWCRRASIGQRNGQTNARNAALRRCGRTRLFRSRWDKIGGPGGPWTTGWVPNHRQQICRHGARGCNCFGRNYCGNYRNGQTTVWWPRGCRGPRWIIRCRSVPQ